MTREQFIAHLACDEFMRNPNSEPGELLIRATASVHAIHAAWGAIMPSTMPVPESLRDRGSPPRRIDLALETLRDETPDRQARSRALADVCERVVILRTAGQHAEANRLERELADAYGVRSFEHSLGKTYEVAP